MGTTKGKDGKSSSFDSSKYARYTPEQVEILERVYNDCPKPSSSKRQQLIKECPILANIGHKQLKVWFQNRRCREKQRKEMGRLQNWNSKLNAMNQLLLEENERLQKQAAQLNSENQYLRQQLQLQQPHVDQNPRLQNPVIMTTTDTSSESVVTSGQHQLSPQHPSQERSLSQLSAIAEKTLAEFLAKATESMMDGIQLPGMKPGPDSIGAFPLTRLCGGVAAQACCLVDMEPFKIAETVKDRPSWLPDCRKLETLASFSADRGGVVELVHTQMYAPTALYVPWEFWSLRYTCCMEDGSLVVCERSLAAGQGIQDMPITPGFARAEMLSSGFLIRPYEHGVSMVVVVDDMNFKSGCLLEGLQPLYNTSVILAKKVTCRVLSYLRSLVKEKTEVSNPSSSLRGLSHRLIRGFNDAVNCFPDEGWVSVINDGPNTLSVHINPTSHTKQLGGNESGIVTKGGIVCVKASLVLHDVPPSFLLCFLKEKWTTWAEFDMDLGYMNSRIFSNDLSKKKFSTVQKLQPLAGQDEVVELMRIQESDTPRFNGVFTSDKFLLQVCGNSEEVKPGDCVQLIFAPIDASMPDDAALLPSGFRILNLNSIKEKLVSSQTLDLASSLEYGKTEMLNSQSAQGPSSVLNIVFQFLYKPENHDIIVPNAQHHVQAIIEILQHAALSLRSHPSPPLTVKSGMEPLILVQQIVESYRSYIGRELLTSPPGDAEAMFKSFWSLKDSIVCCAWKPLPQFIFANQSALEMLETDLVALRGLSLEQMFNDGNRNSDYSQPPPFVLKEGYACLPSGICLSSKGNPVSFERATGWKVITSDQSVQVGAFMFSNWSLASVHM